MFYLCGRNRALTYIIEPHQNQARPHDFEDKDGQYLQAGSHMSGMTMIDPRPESGAYMHVPPPGAMSGYGGSHDGSPLSRTQYTPYRFPDVQDSADPVGQRSPSGLAAIPAYTQFAAPSQTP